MAVSDEELVAAVGEAAARDGMLLCPEAGATLAACEKALAAGLIRREDRVVLFNCATGLKYPLPDLSKRLDRFASIDHHQL
jgi:threonine synthase